MIVILRAVIIAALYVAASPVYLLRLIAVAHKHRRARVALERGFVACRWCDDPVPLARMNTCPSCGFTSPSSLIAPCENCGCGPFPFIECPHCGGSIKVLS